MGIELSKWGPGRSRPLAKTSVRGTPPVLLPVEFERFRLFPGGLLDNC